LKFGKFETIKDITSSISIVTANRPMQEKIPPPKLRWVGLSGLLISNFSGAGK
jgi:hypothetical protein